MWCIISEYFSFKKNVERNLNLSLGEKSSIHHWEKTLKKACLIGERLVEFRTFLEDIGIDEEKMKKYGLNINQIQALELKIDKPGTSLLDIAKKSDISVSSARYNLFKTFYKMLNEFRKEEKRHP